MNKLKYIPSVYVRTDKYSTGFGDLIVIKDPGTFDEKMIDEVEEKKDQYIFSKEELRDLLITVWDVAQDTNYYQRARNEYISHLLD